MSPAPTLYQEILKIAAAHDPDYRDQVLSLAALMERLLVEATRQEQIAFSTLFARMCYVGHKYQFRTDTLQLVHTFRRISARIRKGREAREKDVKLGIKALAETVLVLYQTAMLPDLLAYFPGDDEWTFQPPDIWDFKAVAQVVALRDEPLQHRLVVIDEESPTEEKYVLYDLSDRNENFKPSIQLLQRVFGFPVTLNLLEVDIDRNGHYRPKAFVIEPDYLIDISAIADCFKETGPEPLSYLVKKFLPNETNPAKHVGNVANFFLDRLLNEPDARFPDLFRETFRQWPLIYAPMSDPEVREVSQRSQKHFVTLQAMANGGLLKENIDPAQCVLEPAFFSRQYGIQGRLDLFYHTDERSAIVELKSGAVFRPNKYGITRSHFAQTLLYDLLVRSVFGRQTDPAKYILYSGQPEKPLCFAPTIESEQWEAIQVRNQLVAIERLLTDIRPGQENVQLLSRLSSAAFKGKGFLERDMIKFEEKYHTLAPVDKKYFHAFVGFIAREQWLAKSGEHGNEQTSGHAALWRNDIAEKRAAFNILSHLKIAENCADKPDPYIVFERTIDTEILSNFRTGDIAALYPAEAEDDSLLHHQVIKCTITEITDRQVRLQLRFRQFNLQPFATDALWNLEPDMLEMSFASMYRSLFDNPKPAPKIPTLRRIPVTLPNVPGMTDEQQELLGKMFNATGYFLLWGPPGTGKTSVMLREFARAVLEQSSDNLLLLAYTNRAVDEICEALDSIGGDIRSKYLRIGSQHATAAHFSEQLLSRKTSNAGTRAALIEVLDGHRIFVSTVSSFSQNENLLKIKQFQRLVIDEASQILEPQLVGLLHKFGQFILVGDHRQLPAVTAQRPEWTRVDDPDLNALGLFDLRESYFERLYRRCESDHLEEHFGRLSAQGRMCSEIMDFPNTHFYGGFLKAMYPEGDDRGISAVQFIPTPPPPGMPLNKKTNRTEADQAAQQVLFFKKLWEKEGREWHPLKTLGIITPWRAQIAQLRESLAAVGIPADQVTIDTVERYQGGARDIIIISCCVNSPYQLDSLVNLSGEGVDRKLNVALTRARKYLVMLGDENLLRLDDRYRAFIERYI
jgi:DNA replication ATP-dependent helicase Dna2